MTASVVIVDGHVPPDSATENSRWVAQRTQDALKDRAALIADGEAARAKVEARIDGEVRGLVLCGHGDGGKHAFLMFNQHKNRDADWHRRHATTSLHGAVYGADRMAVLDGENIARMAAGRWFHTIACEVGFGRLPDLAVEEGALAFAAYEQRLVPEFTVEGLPSAAVEILAELVTSTTRLMEGGCFSQDRLVTEAKRLRESLIQWRDETVEGAAWSEAYPLDVQGLHKFAMQFSTALRVVVPSPSSDPVV